MVDELVLSQQDQLQIHHLAHQVTQTGVIQIIFFHGDLSFKCFKRRLLKN